MMIASARAKSHFMDGSRLAETGRGDAGCAVLQNERIHSMKYRARYADRAGRGERPRRFPFQAPLRERTGATNGRGCAALLCSMCSDSAGSKIPWEKS